MSGKFYHFPLPLLSAGDSNYRATIQRITSWCAVTEGRRIFSESSRHDVNEKIANWPMESRPKGFDFLNESHTCVALGFQLLDMRGGGVQRILEEHGQGQEIVQRVEAKDPSGKKSPHVFIASELVWGCHNEGDPDWRSFTAICAVNSIIGMNNYRPVLIRRAMISARMTGFKSKAHRDAADGLSRPSELSTSQLRTTLDKLEMAGFFIRVALPPGARILRVPKKPTGRRRTAGSCGRSARPGWKRRRGSGPKGRWIAKQSPSRSQAIAT